MGLFGLRWRGSSPVVRAATRTLTIGDGPGPLIDGLHPQIAARIRDGAAPDGGALSRAVALQVPAVRRGVNLIAGAVGSLPLARWRDGVQIPSGQLLTQPEAWTPYCRTIAATVRDLIFEPAAFWLVVQRDAWTGYPTRVVRLDPAYVTVEHADGSGEVIREWASYRGREINAPDLIRIDGPDEGLLVHGRTTILTALELELSAGRYARPEVPTGILAQSNEYELTDTEVDALLDRWDRSRREHNTGWVNGGLTYTPVQSTPEALQLVEAREESALQIARHLGVPPRYLAVSSGDSLTYSTLQGERLDLTQLTLAPYLNAIEQRLSMPDRNGSPRGQSIKFDVDAFSRGAPLERAQRYQALVPLGVMSVEEARVTEDLDGPPPEAPAAPVPQEQPA